MARYLRQNKGQAIVLLSGIIICLGMYYLLIPLKVTVDVRDTTYLVLSSQKEDEIKLRFIHSVHKTPVSENFVIEDANKLKLVSMEFEDYGVGIPFLASEGNFTQKDNRFLLTDINRLFNELLIRVGSETKLCIIHKNKEYPIYEWVDAGELIKIRVTHDYLWLDTYYYKVIQRN